MGYVIEDKNDNVNTSNIIIRSFELTGSQGMKATVTNLGARLMSLKVKDRYGVSRDVVMGFASPEDYLPEKHLSDFGAVVGRYANRIAGGQFSVGDHLVQLPQNDGPNCLHGGPYGWQYSIYEPVEITDNSIVLQMVSPDGDSGFPGCVAVRVTYTIGDDNTLRIDYRAETDSPTVINMTNHSYFNLNGLDYNAINIYNHILTVDADRWLPVDDYMIPTGELAAVDGTPYDFRCGRQLKDVFFDDFGPMERAGGIDHCFVLNSPGNLGQCALRAESPYSGIVMEIYTTEPGVQIYSGNFLDGVKGKNNVKYELRDAICFETQQFPDSPNHQWPQSTGRLLPGHPYTSCTLFKFGNN